MIDEKRLAAWGVVLGSTIALMVCDGPVYFFTFGVFLKPITEEFGWSRGAMSLAITVGITLAGLVTPVFGFFIDRVGVRPVTLTAISLYAATFAMISLTPNSVVAFILLYALCGLFAGGHAPLPFAKSISGWFNARRGLALGIAMAGVGLGIALMPQVAHVFVDRYGWRGTYVLLGALTWLIAFPAMLFLVREPLAGRSNSSLGPSNSVEGEDVRSALRRRDFWLMIAASFFAVMVMNGVNVHFVALLTDRGVAGGTAVSMFAAVGLSTIAGRLLSGYLLDRFFAPKLAAVIFLLPLLGTILLAAKVTSSFVILLAGISLGLGLGAEVDVIGYLVGRYFGLRRYGEIYGYTFAAFSVGSGIGPSLMGLSFDATGSYTIALSLFAVLLVAASALIASMGPYRYPAQLEPTVGWRKTKTSPA